MSLRAAIKSWSSLLAIRVLYHAFERFSLASALIIPPTFASMESMPSSRISALQQKVISGTVSTMRQVSRRVMRAAERSTSKPLKADGFISDALAEISLLGMPHRGQNRTAGQALLAAGKFADGYRLIEQEPGFYRSDEFYKLPKDKRLARGTPVSGKSVLLALEGGFGDEVAWGRYAQHLKKACARVLVGALPGSLGTLRTLLGADEVKRFDLIKPHEYDYYLLGMSAADYFDVADPSAGTTFPYLFASPAYRERVRPLIEKIAAGRPKIGVHWQGNKEYERLEQKSYPAALLLPFADLGQCTPILG